MVTFAPERKTRKTAPVGFTLIELLLVIAIMGVLTTLALAVLRSANESARVSATQSRISRIEAILNAEMERYEVRRLPISRNSPPPAAPGLIQYIGVNPWPSVVPPVPANVRLSGLHKRILQDLINCELPRPVLMPDGSFQQNLGLGFFPGRQPASPSRTSFYDWLETYYPRPAPNSLRMALSNLRSGTIQSWADARYTVVDPGTGLPAFNHPGEYLYEILTRIDLDGVPALETLGPTSFGDSDNDGFLEVVDAWGEPLLWLIVQTAVTNPDSTNEIFEDAPIIDWTRRDPVSGMPEGYTFLDSTVPRDLQQVRITVYSKRLNDQGIYNTN